MQARDALIFKPVGSDVMINRIFIRTLIYDIHRQKDSGHLRGNSPEEQYAYYRDVLLKDSFYMDKLYAEFPELQRLILLAENHRRGLTGEIRNHLRADKEYIVQEFCNGRSFEHIEDIHFSGDFHRGGRCTAKVRLDNGIALYYKPHSLEKSVGYQKVYGYLCRKTGMTCKEVKYLSHETYGWEEEIENQSCNTKEAVERYYFRMGIHLFLGYALSATDLHGENIIAHGEYPVIIDMETYPGYFITEEESSAENKIETILAGSVIHTGMLPVLTWGKESNAAVISALNCSGKITTPFRVPVVKKPYTSDIYIDYEPVQFKIKECIVRLHEKVINAAEYAECLIQGFQAAYSAALEDIEVTELLSGFWKGKSRIILRHTQQYMMYLSASFHPDYMKEKGQRKALLSAIHREGETELQRRLRDYEAASLLEMDIPYFEMDGDSCSVFDAQGNSYEGYFPCTPYEAWTTHMKQMDKKDMERQSEFIRLSMALLENQGEEQGKACTAVKVKIDLKCVEKQIRSIAAWLCDNAVVTDGDISWIGLQFAEKERWRLVPVEIGFYSGIAGITVFLAGYLQIFEDEKADGIFRRAVKKMMDYTEKASEKTDFSDALKTGLYDGEGFVIYAYLLLYKITGQITYLHYAQIHFQVIEKFLWEDRYYDYLSGGAGAICAALMLYQAANAEKYLAIAVRLEKQMWEQGQTMDRGFGWRLKDMTCPLAGMAHGNSGFLMAYANLYEATADAGYLEKMFRLLEYEDSLYSETAENWLDMRNGVDNPRIMNAWCHGAPGVLLSRLRLDKLCVRDKCFTDIIRRDISRASRAVFSGMPDGQICLCHGMAGNLLIMQKYLSGYNDKALEKRFYQMMSLFLDKLEDKSRLKVSEYLNPGFMNGISGVGMALIELSEDRGFLQ